MSMFRAIPVKNDLFGRIGKCAAWNQGDGSYPDASLLKLLILVRPGSPAPPLPVA